jgi:hypothetical protein
MLKTGALLKNVAFGCVYESVSMLKTLTKYLVHDLGNISKSFAYKQF